MPDGDLEYPIGVQLPSGEIRARPSDIVSVAYPYFRASNRDFG
jgi:hypothetical protein